MSPWRYGVLGTDTEYRVLLVSLTSMVVDVKYLAMSADFSRVSPIKAVSIPASSDSFRASYPN